MNVPLSSVQLQASGVDWLPLALTLVMMALIFLALRLLSALRTRPRRSCAAYTSRMWRSTDGWSTTGDSKPGFSQKRAASVSTGRAI